MIQPKKKLSKNAKAALKILEESKLLKNARLPNDSKLSQTDKTLNSQQKTDAPNKMRPAKKRG